MSLDASQVAEIDSLATQLFASSIADERASATQRINHIFSSFGYANSIKLCESILTQSTSTYSHVLAVETLTKLITQYYNSFAIQQTIDVNVFLLNYISTHCHTITTFLLNKMLLIIAKIVKYGWRSATEHSELPQRIITQFCVMSKKHEQLGQQLLIEIIDQMNQVDKFSTLLLSENRKICRLFRDNALRHIFVYAWQNLLANSQIDFADNTAVTFDLISHCLTYDFIGLNLDSFDDSTHLFLQIPASWADIFVDNQSIELITTLICKYKQQNDSKLFVSGVTVLTNMASTRKSIFSDDVQRLQFLRNLLHSINTVYAQCTDVIQNEGEFTHVFAQLILKTKLSFTLNDLINVDSYGQYMTNVQSLLIYLLQHKIVAEPYAINFLLNFYSKLVTELTFMHGKDVPTSVHESIEQIVQTYLTYKIDVIVTLDEYDELFDEIGVVEQVSYFAVLGKYKYETCRSYIVNQVTYLFDNYKQTLVTLHNNTNQATVIQTEAKITMLLYMMGALFGLEKPIHIRSNDSDANDKIDQQLCNELFKILYFFSETPTIVYRSSNHFFLSILYCLNQFRTRYLTHVAAGTYIIDSSAAPYMGDSFSIFDYLSEFSSNHINYDKSIAFIIDFILYLLRSNYEDQLILTNSLTLLKNMSENYKISHMIQQYDAVQKIIMENNFARFPWLTNNKYSNETVLFYSIVTKLLFKSANSVVLFEMFMIPIEEILQNIDKSVDYDVKQVRQYCLFILYCVVGVLKSCASKESYALAFAWLKHKYINTVIRVLQSFIRDNDVVDSVTYLFDELNANTNNRINFTRNSVDPVLLFQTTSKALNLFVNTRVNFNIEPSESIGAADSIVYLKRCLQITTKLLSNTNINYGVIEYYNDPLLTQLLQSINKYMVYYPFAEIYTYRKLKLSYCQYIELCVKVLFDMFVTVTTPEQFATMFQSMTELVELNDELCMNSVCVTLINLLETYNTYSHSKNLSKKQEQVVIKLKQYWSELTKQMQSIFINLFNMFLYEQSDNNYIVSQLLFVMLHHNISLLQRYTTYLVAVQPNADVQTKLQADFSEAFGQNIDYSDLKPQNKDTFAMSLNEFRIKVIQYTVKPN